MLTKRIDLAIINRAFWPRSQVIGEGLLQFAELAASRGSVCVITQSDVNLEKKLRNEGRGENVRVFACKAYTNSSSSIVKRALESLAFMCWTAFSLLRSRPLKVYISTNPPVLVPFMVAVYCRIFKAKYYYHLQDIHPEIADIVIPLNKFFYRFLKFIDNYTLSRSEAILTLSADMAEYIVQRSATQSPVFLVDNPFVLSEAPVVEERFGDVVFCGNAGRLQRIPLLLEAIRSYLDSGGKMKFTFAGGGVYSSKLKDLSDDFEAVDYLGFVPAAQAESLVKNHKWALLPIEDAVTSYAFPSKSSAYALSGARIIAICGEQTSVARWVLDGSLGKVCRPLVPSLVSLFFEIEKSPWLKAEMPEEKREKLRIDSFSKRLFEIILG